VNRRPENPPSENANQDEEYHIAAEWSQGGSICRAFRPAEIQTEQNANNVDNPKPNIQCHAPTLAPNRAQRYGVFTPLLPQKEHGQNQHQCRG
jgi:hypothetical protein